MERSRQWLVVGVVAVAEFLTTFTISSVFVAADALVEEWNVSTVAWSWISLAYMSATAAILMPAGKVADLIGRKRLFFLGLVLFTAFTILSAFASSALMLIGLRLLTGLGAALIYACTAALVTLACPPAERGRGLGVQVTGTYLGLTLGPVLGALIINDLGWRWIFLITGLLGFADCLVIWWGMRGVEWRSQRKGRFDLGGSVSWALALVALLVGLSLLPGPWGIALVALGAVGIGVFLWREERASDPILDLDLFRKNRVFLFSNLAIFLSYAAVIAPQFVLPQYLEFNRGLSVKTAGLLLISLPAVQTLFSWSAGRLADRVPARRLSAGGLAVCTVAMGLFVSLGSDTGLWFVVFLYGVLGLGFAFFSVPIMHSVMGSVEPQYSGVASATTASMRMTGQNVSLGVATVVLAIIVGRHSIDPNSATDLAGLLTSTRVTFAILAGICVLGAAASLIGPRKDDEGSRASGQDI